MLRKLYGSWVTRLLATLIAAWGCGGCGDEARTQQSNLEPAVVRIGGSTTLHEAMLHAAGEFARDRAGVDVTVTASSSGVGIAALIDGQLDIAKVSRAPTLAEFAVAESLGVPLHAYQIGYDAVAIIVSPARYADLQAITAEQARAVFIDGTITRWEELAPQSQGALRVYVRDASESGTGELVARKLFGYSGASFHATAQRVVDTPSMIPTIAGDPDGIGFAPLGFVDRSVRMLAFGLDRTALVSPSPASVRDLSYPLRRDLFLITRGEAVGITNDFIRFVLREDTQALLAQHGLVSLW